MKKLLEKLQEAPHAVVILVSMWAILTLTLLLVYYIPTDNKAELSNNGFPKIMSEMWKYVTGAVVSALTTLAGRAVKSSSRDSATKIPKQAVAHSDSKVTDGSSEAK
jgi:hypothetical protein